MNTPETLLSHRQHILAQIVHDDPDTADLLFELMALTDASTPRGAACHADVLHDLYAMTSEYVIECERKVQRLKDGFIQWKILPEESHESVS